jgi:hypothetical protein
MVRLVVLTGGPGAGKTAALEVVRKHFKKQVTVLPESAGIVFGGGFPRHTSIAARRAAQRAIFHIQRELERLALEEAEAAVLICDRGTVDGVAYWPGSPESFWEDVGADARAELLHYDTVIHLSTPASDNGFDHSNPLRIESQAEAHAIDQRIRDAWDAHPRRFEIPPTKDFLVKVGSVLALIDGELVRKA